MTPQAIVSVLDKCRQRINEPDGFVKWPEPGQKVFANWYAHFNQDNQVLAVMWWNRKTSQWIQRSTKFAQPYGAPR